MTCTVPFTGLPFVPFGAPSADWMDAATRACEQSLQWQAAWWQPWFDLQGRWMEQWQQQFGWPVEPLAERGIEQLA